MLNAFRHHGERDRAKFSWHRCLCAVECSTPFGITASGTGFTTSYSWRFALRCSTPFGITASGTRERGTQKTAWEGAQRLSASRRAGQHAGRPPRCRHRVLNAFRHHGERDAPDGVTRLGGLHVLNAFRHHGERDAQGKASPPVHHPCSTPFGITASGTVRPDSLVFLATYRPPFQAPPPLHAPPAPHVHPAPPNPPELLGFSPFMHLFTCQRAPTP